MRVTGAHRSHWQERQARELEGSDSRLRRALPAASRCAEALHRRWPGIDGVWLFGSTIDGRFGMASDSDIPVDLVRLESLPPHWQQRIRERGQRLQ